MNSDPTRWQKGELAILSNFGWRDLSVIRVIDWDDVVPLGRGEFENLDEDTIRTTRGTFDTTWERGGGYVPGQVVKTYGEGGHGRTTYTGAPGKIVIPIPNNLYKNLDELIEQEGRSLYPDLVMKFLIEPPSHIDDMLADFSQFKSQQSASDLVDYQIFDVNGHSVQVIRDVGKESKNPGIMKTRGTEGIFYWHIPELQTRSMDKKSGTDLSPWGGGTYPTMKLALESAEKFLDHVFHTTASRRVSKYHSVSGLL